MVAAARRSVCFFSSSDVPPGSMPGSWGSASEGAEVLEPSRCGVVALPPGLPPFRILHISGTSLVHGRRGETYVVYHIRVACAGAFPSAWTCYRRYAEFDAVFQQLRVDGLGCAAPPPKRLFGNLSGSFVAERTRLLEQWLKELPPEVLGSEAGRRFLTKLADTPPPMASRDLLPPAPPGPPPPGREFAPTNSFSDVAGTSSPMDVTEGSDVESLDDVMDEDGDSADEGKDPEGAAPRSKRRPRPTLDDYSLVRVVGKGSFGKVLLVRRTSTGDYFAMKVLTKSTIRRRRQIEHTKTERSVLARVDHPFIVKLHAAFQTPRKLYFVLDFCSGGELFFHQSRLKVLPEHVARFYAGERARGERGDSTSLHHEWSRIERNASTLQNPPGR